LHTTRHPHATEADAPSAIANSNRDVTFAAASAVESATASVTASAKSPATTVVTCPCYRTERHDCDANYQTNYYLNFHI